MIIETLSVFPRMFDNVMGSSIMRRAQEKGLLEFRAHNLRDWTHDVHRTTDDAPYGGGPGLLMKVEPVYEAMDDLLAEGSATVVIPTPVGDLFTQRIAEELSGKERIVFICGRYEGFDERVYELADMRLSIGDFVLTGGELAAMVMTDAICRLIPGVLGDDASALSESFSAEGLLEYPQYTRPASYRGMDVPEILLSGDHGRIAAWRRRMSLERTAVMRPDLLESAELTDEENDWVRTWARAASPEKASGG